ncbi:hypothetical protein GCM10025859_02450 [Alicyclobacillus fastidiosus]|nr:hypothetical protein GCM10025859_02450 [Alicyclobacillus fastidiosus]
MTKPVVGVIMGSQSDWDTMVHACEVLDELQVPYEKKSCLHTARPTICLNTHKRPGHADCR